MRIQAYTERMDDGDLLVTTSFNDDVFENDPIGEIGNTSLDDQLASSISERGNRDRLRPILEMLDRYPEDIKNTQYYNNLVHSVLRKVHKLVEREFNIDFSLYGLDPSNHNDYYNDIQVLYDFFVINRYKFSLNALKGLILHDDAIYNNSKKMIQSQDQTYLNLLKHLDNKKQAAMITALPNILKEYTIQENTVTGTIFDLLSYNGDYDPYGRDDILGRLAINNLDDQFICIYVKPLLIDNLLHSKLLIDLKSLLFKEFTDFGS